MLYHCLFWLFAISSSSDLSLGGIVFDPNGSPIREAHVLLENPTNRGTWEVTTKDDGAFQFERLELGTYRLTITKEGFFVGQTDVRLESNKIVEFTLAPLENLQTQIEVVARPDPINTQTVAAQQTVNDAVIQSIPYTGRRNFLNAITLMPGILADNHGQIHIHGSRSDQIRYQLDGVNITDPSTGAISSNIPIDAIESVDLDMAGYSAALGKGSGGVVQVNSQFVSDRFRWDLTDFVPGINFERKTIAEFSPRWLMSGPMVRNRLWFMHSGSIRYVRTFNEDLPESQNRQVQSVSDQLLKLKWNLRESHTLTGSVLHNSEYVGNLGLSIYRPAESTTNFLKRGITVALTDRVALGGVLFEASLQWTRRRDSDLARGNSMLDVRPSGWSGNYFMDRRGQFERIGGEQSAAWEKPWKGVTHRFEAGISFDHVVSELFADRRPFQFRTSEGELRSHISFDGSNFAEIVNREYGAYLQDRLILSPGFQVEFGMRFDREDVVKRNNLGPRVSFLLLPFGTDRSKLSGGVGLFHDNIALLNLQLPRMQRRFTTYFDKAGNPVAVTIPMATAVSSDLRNPAGLHWNMAWEHEWAPRWVSRVNIIQKRGRDQVRLAALPRSDGFDLQFDNSGSADYQAVEIAIDRPIRTNLRIAASYIYSRSMARPSMSLDFPDPAIESAAERPTDWHNPHRFVSWGYFPFVGGLHASYSMEARSGFPFSLLDEQNRIVGDYNSHHFPAHVVTNLSVEREIPIPFRKRMAFRIGVTNVFNRFNPRYVDSNIASPQFGRFSDSSGRHFVGRVRILKK